MKAIHAHCTYTYLLPSDQFSRSTCIQQVQPDLFCCSQGLVETCKLVRSLGNSSDRVMCTGVLISS
jgi:hypothetical protein